MTGPFRGESAIDQSVEGVGVATPTPGEGRGPSPATQRAYAADWALFCQWCRQHDCPALPASAKAVAAFLDHAQDLSLGTLTRRAAAISGWHRGAGFVSPTQSPAVKTVLRTARATAVSRRPTPPAPPVLLRMAAHCPGDLAGLRDRALLLLAKATGLKRAALMSLNAEDVRFTDEGVALDFRGAGRVVDLSRHRGVQLCSVRALEDWLRLSDTSFGPVFRKIDRWGNVEHRRLGTDAMRRIILRRGRPG